MNQEKIGRFIASCRKKQKLTQEQLAEKLGISVQAVRIGLQRGVFPFGWAIKTSEKKYTYAISEKLFNEYLGSK